MITCLVEECDSKLYCRGLCRSHYDLMCRGYNFPALPAGRNKNAYRNPEVKINKPTDFELGWLVGILEGEGCFSTTGRKQATISINMTDEDTMLRYVSLINKILGLDSTLKYTDRSKWGSKDSYWHAVYGANARALMLLVVKHMSWRRRQVIWQTLNRYKPPKQEVRLDLQALGLAR